jgi:magnesium transporter
MSYGVLELAKKRFFWLMVLMVSGIFTGMIITHFEKILAIFPALIAAIPMLMDTGGNAGSQSSTLIIRGMALGELGISDCFRILWKEIRISVVVGSALGSFNVIYRWLLSGNLSLALTVGASLLVTVMLAQTLGSMLPLLAKALKLDPALMAAPIVTTLVDASGLIVYFCVAASLLRT